MPGFEAVSADDRNFLKEQNVYLVTLRNVFTPEGLDLSRVKNELAPPVVQPPLPRKFPTPPGADWPDFTVQVVSKDSARFSAGQISERYTWEGLGLLDRRRGDMPNKLWDLLRDLAAHHGRIDHKTRTTHRYTNKDFSRLRQVLKEFTGLTSDPFLGYKQTRAYQTKFKIEDLSYGPPLESADSESEPA